MRAKSIMTTAVHTCRPSNTLEQAVRTMWEHDIGGLPVVDERNRPIAMITDRDAVMAAYFAGRPLREILVNVAMSKSLVACRSDTCIEEVEFLMQSARVRRLPVVNRSGDLVGIIGVADLVRASISDERWATTLPKTVRHILDRREEVA